MLLISEESEHGAQLHTEHKFLLKIVEIFITKNRVGAMGIKPSFGSNESKNVQSAL